MIHEISIKNNTETPEDIVLKDAPQLEQELMPIAKLIPEKQHYFNKRIHLVTSSLLTCIVTHMTSISQTPWASSTGRPLTLTAHSQL